MKMTNRKLASLTLAAALGLSLSACSSHDMTTRERNTALGAGIGALGGAVLTDGSAAGAIGGAAVGGIVGHQIKK